MKRYLTTVAMKLRTSKGVVELKPGDTFKPKDASAIKELLTEGKVRPLKEVMAERYRELTAWLHQFDLGGDELKETLPDLYTEALLRCERKVAIKVWSETLGCFL